jgi:hypothetical protein
VPPLGAVPFRVTLPVAELPPVTLEVSVIELTESGVTLTLAVLVVPP